MKLNVQSASRIIVFICLTTCASATGVLTQLSNNAGIYSFHPDSENFPFADGSVRFPGTAISARTIVALLTCAMGDSPDTDY
jgi:hypothetical protein